MGFLQAVRALGLMARQRSKNSSLADIMSFLQFPHPLGDAEDRRAYVIRIWLEVSEPDQDYLDVKGISHIDLAEYPGISSGDEQIKERYLYREPVGKAAPWSFSPIYKLGKGNNNAIQQLLGENWENDKKCRYYKLRRAVLNHYEESGCFSAGSVERIMSELVARVDEVADYWADKQRSYLLVFGVNQEGRFAYPGEVPALVKYFREKLASPKEKLTDMGRVLTKCALCETKTSRVETLDKVFKFATFDKESFLPGIKGGQLTQEKVFPICPECYALLSAGKDEMDNRFINFRTIPGINLYVIPELISDDQRMYNKVAKNTEDFLLNGIKYEKRLFDSLARQDGGLVYHFLFAEPNQAQLKVHFLVEDVPPSRLNRLQELWKETCQAFSGQDDSDHKRWGLDTAFRQIVAVLNSLSGKREQDKIVMRERVLLLINGLLNEEKVAVSDIKTVMVSRFSGLFTDPDWMSPKKKEDMPGPIKLKGMAEVVDFLIRANRRRDV